MCDFTEMTPYIAELRAAQTANPSPATSDPGRNPLPAPAGVVGDSNLEQIA